MATLATEYTEGLEISPFCTADLDEIMEIENQSFSAPWSRDAYLDLAPLKNISFYVVRYENRLVGYMLYETWEAKAELHTIAVAPDLRRQGIAQGMIKYMIGDIKKRGMGHVFLQVRPSNSPARLLYSKFNFQIIGVRNNYYRDNGEDALVLRLDL